ncbi:uncharacterized protein LOC127726709 isoform X2 [Mytilus californianus]|uniref:uncharacterized protein LOC127726709 isoform X2 n=1 Tax=Mytilus californianus TaxID=6549 RepID=UPI0022484D1B|nr:uncharacterized protein LOC127726709 isoform X2 [Mytilus californianus]
MNKDGDRISNQNQTDGAHRIVSGTEVDEIKGNDSSLNMEKRTPKNNGKQAERNETHLPPDVGFTDNNVPGTDVPLSRIHKNSVSSSNNLDEYNDISEQTETGVVAENSRGESEPISLHPDIQHNKEKGAIPKKCVAHIEDIIRKGHNKIKVDTDQDEHDKQSDLNNSASRHSDDNVKDKIDEEVDIYLQNKKKEDKNIIIKAVMKYICACLNSDGGVVKLKNHHWKKAIGKDLDDWYNDLEKQLFDDSSKFIELEGKYHDELLFLRIRPLNYIFSVDMYLYFPRNTDIVAVRYNQAIDILRTYDKSGSLTELPAVAGDFEYKKTQSTLSENDQIQFKEIKSAKVPSKFSSMINKYISAFCNHKGGRIFFGIEDKEFKVVGVPLTELDKESITRIMYAKMDQTMKWGCDSKSYVYGTHWSIDFLPVKIPDNINVTIPEGTSLEVIIVSVCRYPGGVFTDTPNAYYIRKKDRTIQQFTFQEWKTKMISSHKGIPFTQGCGEVLQTSVDNLSDDVSDANKTVHHTQRDVLNIKEIVSDTASNVSVIKEIVEGGSLPSQKPKIPSNLFEHHVTHDYKCTRNDVNLQEILEKHKCVTVKGYIGTGKSQLALNYGLQMKKDNNLVWKFECSNIQELWRSMAYLLKELRFKIKDTENKKDDILFMARTINEYLEKNHTRMHILIFEDVIDDSRNIIETFINVYLAKRGNLKVLVTSSLSVTEIELEIVGFSEEEAIDFIDAIEANDAEREELVKAFSCNPLGLKIAIRYIKHCQISVGAFLGKLSVPKGALEIENSPVIAQRCELKPLFQSLHLILSDIHSKDPSILQRILLMQFLGSDKIPAILLENAHLNFFSGKIKEEGRSNGPLERIDDVISTLKHYSFASVSGIDEERVLHTHSAILLATENYTSESNDITVMDMLKALLWAVVSLMHKDNRMKADLDRHIYLLPYAESILNRTRKLLEITNKAETKQFMDDLSFSLPLVYVSDIVGYTYDFDEMHHFGEVYFQYAKSYFIEMVGMSVLSHGNTIEDIQINAKKTATQLNRKMASILKQNTKMLNTVGKWYILNKHRSRDELEIIQNGLQKAGKSLNGKLRTDEDLNLLCENKLAVPKKRIGYFYFFEVGISLLYSYGRRLFYTVDKTSDSLAGYYCYFLYVADHLSNIVDALNPEWKILHSLLTKRSGTIQQAIENSHFPETDLKKLKNIAERCLYSVEDKSSRYFLFGTVFMETDSDVFNKVIWLKQLVRCYKRMLKVAEDESERDEIEQKGKDHVNHLYGLIQEFKHTSSFPSLLLCIGEFYQCIRDFHRARITFRQLYSKPTQPEQKVKARKHERKAYIYYLQCFLLEQRKNKSENLQNEACVELEDAACKEVENLIPNCHKIVMNHAEEKMELEHILFMSTPESILKHEERACIQYLNSRLRHLQYGSLNRHDYNLHVKEIEELLQKFSDMPLKHEMLGLADMKSQFCLLEKKQTF